MGDEYGSLLTYARTAALFVKEMQREKITPDLDNQTPAATNLQ